MIKMPIGLFTHSSDFAAIFMVKFSRFEECKNFDELRMVQFMIFHNNTIK